MNYSQSLSQTKTPHHTHTLSYLTTTPPSSVTCTHPQYTYPVLPLSPLEGGRYQSTMPHMLLYKISPLPLATQAVGAPEYAGDAQWEYSQAL